MHSPPRRRLTCAAGPGPQFYASVQANDLNQWLETLSEDLLFKCSAAEPGPFAAVGWYKARSKLDKYGVVYKFQDLLEPDGGAGVRVRYSAHFGAIPGYREGDALAQKPLPGPDPHAQGSGVVEIHLIEQLGDWKVSQVVY